MEIKTNGGEMTTEQLITSLKAEGLIKHNREKSDTMFWLTDQTQRFLSFRNGEVSLWKCNPGRVNDKLDTIPMEQATPETIACMI